MVLILFSIILAAIAVAISVTRCHSSFGILAGSGIAREKISVEKERAATIADYQSGKAILGRGATRREGCQSSRSGPPLLAELSPRFWETAAYRPLKS